MRAASLVFALLAGLVACGEGGSPGAPSSVPPVVQGSSPSPVPLVITPPPNSIFLGVYVNPSNVPSPPPSLLDTFQTQIGRTLALSPHYYGFYDLFPGPNELDDVANGRIPFISWGCQPPNSAIASGADDTYIRKLAQSIAAFRYPIFLRYMWEMNLPSSETFHKQCYDPNTDLANGFFSPGEYILAWRRIRAIFAQQGVSNVVWVWNPSGANNPAPYFPGNDEVDWVGFDYYDRENVTVAATYSQPYAFLQVYGKPIIVGETGATGAEQQLFFASLPSTLRNQFPQVKALIYFDGQNIQNASVYTWTIIPNALSSFTTMANSPYMSAIPTVSPVP